MAETKLLPALSVPFIKLVFMEQAMESGSLLGPCTWCHKPASESKISFTCYILEHLQEFPF